MKKIISFFVLAFIALMPLHADQYRDALKKYLTSSDVVSIEQIQQMAQSILMQQGADQNEISKLISEYVGSQMMDDMVDLFLPYFQKYVSMEDLKKLTKTQQQKRYSQLMSQTTATMQDLAQNTEYQQLAEQLGEGMKAILEGKEPQLIPMVESITNSYQQIFDRYFDVSGTKKSMESVFSSFGDLIVSALGDDQQTNVDSIYSDYVTYTSESLRNMMLNIFSKVYSEKDLNYLTKKMDNTAYIHCVSATNEAGADLMLISVDFLEKMGDWTMANHPEFEKTVNNLREFVTIVKSQLLHQNQ